MTATRLVAPAPPAVRSRLRAEAPILVLLVLAALLRLAVLLGFPPVMWFWGDSYAYLGVALHPAPYDVRPVGYSFFLLALQPLHNLAAVAAVQHLIGLLVGAGLYALLRRLAVTPGLAALAAAPVLLDAYQLQLEQLLMAETLTLGLVAGAIGLLTWRARPSAAVCAWAGLLLALAVLTRSVAVVLAGPALLYLLARRVGVVAVCAAAVAFAVPLHIYAGWFWAVHGERALSASDGFFLYGRVMTWASCPGPVLRYEEERLCDDRPPGERPGLEYYVWDGASPTRTIPGSRVDRNEVLRRFSLRVVRDQPLGYARAVLTDLGRLVSPVRSPFPSEFTAANYSFAAPPRELPPHVVADVRRYQEGGDGQTRRVQPLAGALAAYQQVAYVPSPLYVGAAVLAGVGVVRGRSRGPADRRRAVAVLLLLGGVGQLLLPIAVQGFDYRYGLPALPLLGGAAALGVHLLRERRRPAHDVAR